MFATDYPCRRRDARQPGSLPGIQNRPADLQCWGSRRLCEEFFPLRDARPAVSLRAWILRGARVPADQEHGYTFGSTLIRPYSTGYLTLRSSNPLDSPV